MNSIARTCSRLHKLSPSFTRQCLVQRSSFSVAATAEQPLELPDKKKVYPEKLHNIVNSIGQLSLLEVSELNQLLKKTLNIPDAPMMAVGAVQAAPAAVAEEEAEQVVTKSAYTVKLVKFEDTKKVALIKEIKTLVEGMNLVQAKKFVESVPQIIKSDISKEEAEKLKTKLESLGGVVVVS